MNSEHCLVIDNNIQCTFPSMKGHDFCMFHTDVLHIRSELPTLYDIVIEKLREGLKLGTIHIPHGRYNWSNKAIYESALRLKADHGLSCKINITNTMVYRPRFNTKEERIAHKDHVKELWKRRREKDDTETDDILEFGLVVMIIAVFISLVLYVYNKALNARIIDQ